MNNTEKDVFLHNLYYNEKYLVGRDLLFYKVSKTLGVKDISRRYIARWLAKQTVNQVYTNKKKPTNIRPIITSRPGAMLQMDLIDYSKKPQEGFKYILNVIDTFSRKVWLEPLKRKTIAAVIPQLNSIVQDIQKDYTIKVIQSDNGGEFNIAFPNITHIQSQPHTPQQNALVERSNGTVKKILNKLLFAGKIQKWDEDILLQVENVYNDTLNTALGKSPDEAYKLDPESQKDLHEKLKASQARCFKEIDTKLSVGDSVRLLIPTGKIKSKGLPLWTEDIYKVKTVIPGNAAKFTIPRYRVSSNDQVLKGSFPLSKLFYIPK